jgi:hypothetical protein
MLCLPSDGAFVIARSTQVEMDGIMIYGSRKAEHNRLFDRFVYELFCEPVKDYHEAKSTLHKFPTTRSKFLQRMKEQKKNDPGEL